MIFRLKVLFPLLCLVILAWVLKDWVSLSLMKKKLQENLPGLELRNLEIDVLSENLELDASATYSDQKGSLASLAKLELRLNREALGLGEVVASGNIEDLRLNKRLFISPDGVDSTLSGNGKTPGSSSGEPPGFSFDTIDHREILERFTGERQLETEKKIDEASKLIEGLEKKWLSRQKELKHEINSFKQNRETWAKNWASSLKIEPLLKEAKKLQSDAKELKTMRFDGRDLAQLASNLQKIQSFQNQISQLQKNFKGVQKKAKGEISKLGPLGQTLGDPSSLSREIKTDLIKLTQLKESISSSTKNDIEMLKKELNPKNFNSSKTVRLIMGREWELKFKSSLEILDRSLGTFLPQTHERNASVEGQDQDTDSPLKSPQASPVPILVSFQRDIPRPTWNISSLRYAGYAQQAFEDADVRFEGTLHDLSSDESILGRPPRLSLTAYLPGRGGQLNLGLRYSLSENTPDQRVMKVNLTGRPLDGTTMGSRSSRLLFESGSWDLDGTVDLSSAPNWVMKGHISFKETVFDLSNNVKENMRAPLRAAADRLFSTPIAFTYRYPTGLVFEGDFQKWMGPIFNDALLALSAQEQQALTAKLMGRLSPKVDGLFDENGLERLLQNGLPLLLKGALGEKNTFNQLKSLAGSNLKDLNQQDALLGQLLAEVLGLKTQGDQAQGNLEDQLKDEAKRRLQEMAAEKLGETLFGGKSESEATPGEKKDEKTPKDPKDALKDELKKELKEALKGFPF